MKKFFLISVLLITIASSNLFSQSVGFSYFFPKNGYFSNPIAPVNLSFPLKFSEYFKISGGIGMTNIGGMSMTGFPESYNSERALVGPFQSLELNIIPTLVLPFKTVKFDLFGGVFGFTSFNCKMIGANFNEMIALANNYSFVDSNIIMDKSALGWGYLFGGKINIRVSKKVWAYIGASYYLGGQKMALNGDYTAINVTNNIVNNNFNFPETSILYQGLQLSIGAVLK